MSFTDFNLHPALLRAVGDLGFQTPTPIQTREERVDQVYAVKVRVPNPDGRIKIGMPGELVLHGSAAGGQP